MQNYHNSFALVTLFLKIWIAGIREKKCVCVCGRGALYMDFYVEYSLSPTHDLILPYWDYSLVQTGAFNSLDIPLCT